MEKCCTLAVALVFPKADADAVSVRVNEREVSAPRTISVSFRPIARFSSLFAPNEVLQLLSASELAELRFCAQQTRGIDGRTLLRTPGGPLCQRSCPVPVASMAGWGRELAGGA